MVEYRNFSIHGDIAPSDAPRWNADHYNAAVVENLRHIEQSDVGRAVFTYVTQPVLIVPTARRDAVGARANYAIEDASAAGADIDASFPGWQGTGLGTPAAWIDYLPEMWRRFDQPRVMSGSGLVEFHSDGVLLHEIVHTTDAFGGTLRGGSVGFGFQSVAEYRAVLITNMYRSERHIAPRANYQDNAWIDARSPSPRHRGYRVSALRPNPLGISNARVQFERRMVEQLIADNPTLTRDLEAIRPMVLDYNPFRAFRTGNYDRIPVPGDWVPPRDHTGWRSPDSSDAHWVHRSAPRT